jgi:hypothetical protein
MLVQYIHTRLEKELNKMTTAKKTTTTKKPTTATTKKPTTSTTAKKPTTSTKKPTTSTTTTNTKELTAMKTEITELKNQLKEYQELVPSSVLDIIKEKNISVEMLEKLLVNINKLERTINYSESRIVEGDKQYLDAVEFLHQFNMLCENELDKYHFNSGILRKLSGSRHEIADRLSNHPKIVEYNNFHNLGSTHNAKRGKKYNGEQLKELYEVYQQSGKLELV